MKGFIPREFINDLVTRSDIVEVISSRVKLKKAGKNYQACCPFHHEKTPSFNVNPSMQRYKCFGCGVSGGVIDFLMKYDGLEFPEAIEELAGMQGLEVPREQQNLNDGKPPISFKAKRNLYELLDAVAKFYQENLAQNEIAQQYVAQRGLSSEIIQRFEIGFAIDSFNAVVRKFGTNREEIQKLLDTRVVSQNDRGIYDFFRNRLMFPIRDRRGRVVAFGGRTIANDERKYMNSGESATYHKSNEVYGLWQVLQVNENPEFLFVVEGYMDAVSLAQYGIDNAVAVLGTASTTEQIKQMFRVTEQIICCFDGDNAGKNAAWKAFESALPHLEDGRQLKFVFLPDGEDPDSFIRSYGKQGFEEYIQNAQSLSEFVFEHWLTQVNLATNEGKSKLAKIALPIIKQIPGETLRLYLRNTLGQKLGIFNEEQLDALLKIDTTVVVQEKTMERTPMRILIALLLQQPDLVQFIPDLRPLADLNEAGFSLLCELTDICREKTGISTAGLLEHWRDSKQYPILEKLANWDHLILPDNIQKEFLEKLNLLYNKLVERQIETLIAKYRTVGLTESEYQTLALLSSQQ